MRLFLGIALCGLLPGIAMARGGMGGGFHGGGSAGPRGGPGGIRGKFGGFRKQPGGVGFNQAFSFGYVGGGFLDYGGAEAESEPYWTPPYISIAGPYISIASPYIGSIGAADDGYVPAEAGVGYPWDPGEPSPLQARPHGTLPLYPSRNLTFDQSDHAVKGTAARFIDDSDSRVLVWIAFKDHFIDTAVAYWVKGKDLYYIKTDGGQRQVSLGLVDRSTSARLNARGPGKLVLP